MNRHTGAPRVHSTYYTNNCTVGTDCPPKAGRPVASGGKKNKEQVRWQKRAQAKSIDTEVSKRLWNYAKAEQAKDPEHRAEWGRWRKRYARSSFCCHDVEQQGDLLKGGHRCNGKWCRLCSRIKAGDKFSKYGKQLADLPELHLVTVTQGPRVTADQLPDTLQGMVKAWRKLYRKLRDRGIVMKGYRALEITYDAHLQTYHPHFHILVSGIDAATGIQSLWMQHYGEQVSQGGQECRVILSHQREGAVVEILKYTHKTVDDKELVAPAPLHVINAATYGKQMKVAFGLKAAKDSTTVQDDDLDTTDVRKADWLPFGNYKYHWDSAEMNWVCRTGGWRKLVEWDYTATEKLLQGNGPP